MKVAFILAPFLVATAVLAHPPEKRGDNHEHTKVKQHGLEETLTVESKENPHGHHDSHHSHSEHHNHHHKEHHNRERRSLLSNTPQNLRRNGPVPKDSKTPVSSTPVPSRRILLPVTPNPQIALPSSLKEPKRSTPLTNPTTKPKRSTPGVPSSAVTKPTSMVASSTKESTTLHKSPTTNNNAKQLSPATIPTPSKTSASLTTRPLLEKPSTPASKAVLPPLLPLRANNEMKHSPTTAQPHKTGTQTRAKRSPLLFSKTTTTTARPSSTATTTITTTTSTSYTTETLKSNTPTTQRTPGSTMTTTIAQTTAPTPTPSGLLRTNDHIMTSTTTHTSTQNSPTSTFKPSATISRDVKSHTTEANKPTTTSRTTPSKL